MDRKRLHTLRAIGRLMNVPPLPFIENFSQRFGNGGVVLIARNFFFGRAVKRDEMVASDCAFLGLEFGERFGVGNGGIKNDDCLRRQIVGDRCPHEHEQKRECQNDWLHQKLSFSPS